MKKASSLLPPFAEPAARTQAASRVDGAQADVLAIALQFGLGITVLAYMTAHSSGGHINFAVSLAGVSAQRSRIA